MRQINGRIEELCMEIEVFLEIEGNTSQLEANTCFAILLSEIEVITHNYRSKCIFSGPYQIEAFSRNIEVNTCLLFYIE